MHLFQVQVETNKMKSQLNLKDETTETTKT